MLVNRFSLNNRKYQYSFLFKHSLMEIESLNSLGWKGP